jgi:hypothetical protein
MTQLASGCHELPQECVAMAGARDRSADRSADFNSFVVSSVQWPPSCHQRRWIKIGYAGMAIDLVMKHQP